MITLLYLIIIFAAIIGVISLFVGMTPGEEANGLILFVICCVVGTVAVIILDIL